LIIDYLTKVAFSLFLSVINYQKSITLPGGVIGNTGGFGPPIPGSSPGRVGALELPKQF
jgi:hypothetical protein